MIALPADPPVTIPEEAPTEAIRGDEVVQVPPDVVLVRVDELPEHKLEIPLMADGKGLTVNTKVEMQPERV